MDGISSGTVLQRLRCRLSSGPGKYLSRLLGMLLLTYVVLFLFAGLLQRGSTGALPDEVADPAILKEFNEIRNPVPDPDNRPYFRMDVDYSLGRDADWWPKGESPLFANLVEQGVLPPVEDRMGPEPAVQRGFAGIGQYGGDWWLLATDVDAVRLFLQYTIPNNTLVRYSPYGDPILPHVAREVIPSDDYRVWTVHLRRGIRWSDGHPFSADDIMFWWEHVANDAEIGFIPETMRVNGLSGYIERLDDFTVRYVFPESNPGFLLDQASAAGALYMAGPSHYLRQFHHELGDQELIQHIAETERIRPGSVMQARSFIMNPERPSLSPWLLRTHRDNGPWTLVRNPYYFVVDEEGNQLPYIDRIVFRQVSPQLIDKSIMDGSASAALAGMTMDYTSLMNQREQGGYEVRHLFSGGTGQMTISPNRHLPVTREDPGSAVRRELLGNKEFRRALSIAVNRQQIIDADLMGFGEPIGIGPGPGEVGHDPEHLRANAEFDPERANRILDELGLTERDAEGYRAASDGTRLTFRLVTPPGGSIGTLLFVREDWKNIGLRIIVQQRPHRLMLMERTRADFVIAAGSTALGWEALGAGTHNYFGWYHRGGLYGAEEAMELPQQPSELEQHVMRAGERARVTPDPDEQLELVQEVMKHSRDQVWLISIQPPSAMRAQSLMVVKDGLNGVPEVFQSDFGLGSPNNAAPESWYWDDPNTINGYPASESYLNDRTASILSEIQQVRLPSRQLAQEGHAADTGFSIGWVVQIAIWSVVGLFILMSALRHPFVIRRLCVMVPTLIVISIIVYVGIQLPPGSYLDTRLYTLEEQGLRAAAEREIEDLRERFHLDDGKVVNYFRWTGVLWFFTYENTDRGLLQGHLGFSMVNQRPVNDLLGDRILLTFLLSFGTILFTWFMAIPVGIYSAVRQYSPGDYVLTVIGFIGMCIPNFIFALVLMLLSRQLFDFTISGLFSSQYAMQDYWDWAKFVDLLKHLWIPVIVIGTAGTAGMIRVMRANLLDELKKPYVVTARAKGVRPVRLLFKYPVRLALNPFVSGIGGILPELISGGAIVSIILSLPTVGPLLLDAVMLEDIYMAGSLLLVLSVLSVIGVLISDLLLMAIDPRIRMTGGQR